MKKIRIFLVFILCIATTFSASGCDCDYGYVVSPNPENTVCENNFTQEKLMSVRDIVRESNIAIDTIYQKKGIFFSRTQGVQTAFDLMNQDIV